MTRRHQVPEIFVVFSCISLLSGINKRKSLQNDSFGRNAKAYDLYSTRGATIWKLSSGPCQATTRMLTQKLFHIIKMQPWGQVKNYSLTVAIRVNASHNWNNMGH